jgi:hypothetical protein
MEQEPLRMVIGIIMKISLFQAFAQIKYKKFGCLINFGMSYTHYSDVATGPGFDIVCGEVIFLANCSRLAKILQNNPSHFWDQFDQYKEDANFNRVNLRLEFLPLKDQQHMTLKLTGKQAAIS